MDSNNNFGRYLKILLSENNMTMTRLSKESGIDKATISRIANNKQIPNNTHLKKLSAALNVPLNELFAKINEETIHQDTTTTISKHENSITNFANDDPLESFSELLENTDLSQQVEKELLKYQQLMNTDEGEKIITSDFDNKISNLTQTGPFVTTLKNLYDKFCSKTLPRKEFILIGSVLLYFILPIDIIPDFLFPIGFIDDMIAVGLISTAIYPYLKDNN